MKGDLSVSRSLSVSELTYEIGPRRFCIRNVSVKQFIDINQTR